MSSQSLRLHVGNLPHNVTSQDVEKKFNRYGVVKSLEIKHKREAGTNTILSTFSFINLDTDPVSFNKCLQGLNGATWDGQCIRVSIAKESFLERLKKERELAQKVEKAPAAYHQCQSRDVNSEDASFSAQKQNVKLSSPKDSYKPPQSVEGAKKRTSISVEDTLFKDDPKQRKITQNGDKGNSCDVLRKLELFSDVWRDSQELPEEPQIQMQSSSDGGASDSEDENELSNKLENHGDSVSLAEERRIKSLVEKQKALEQQKKAVKLALSDEKVLRVNRKVIFNDDDPGGLPDAPNSPSAPEVSQKRQQSKAFALFNDSDNEESNNDQWGCNFQIKKQFEGRNGKELLKLQSRFNNDERFTLDERFIVNDEENKESQNYSKEDEENSTEEHVDDVAAEREQQLQILSNVLGHPVSISSSRSKESATKPMLRFDPTKPNHMKYEIAKEGKGALGKKAAKLTLDIDSVKRKVQRKETDPEPVSKETFYKVADSLTDSFKTSKDNQVSGFSLLQMFGSQTNNTGKNENETKSNPGQNFSEKFSLKRNFENFGAEVSEENAFAIPSNQIRRNNLRGSVNQNIVQQESFFFQPDDSRLKEGAEFFIKNDDDLNFYAFRRKRRELAHLVNRKIQRNAQRANAFKTKFGGNKRPRPSKARTGLNRRKGKMKF